MRYVVSKDQKSGTGNRIGEESVAMSTRSATIIRQTKTKWPKSAMGIVKTAKTSEEQ